MSSLRSKYYDSRRSSLAIVRLPMPVFYHERSASLLQVHLMFSVSRIAFLQLHYAYIIIVTA